MLTFPGQLVLAHAKSDHNSLKGSAQPQWRIHLRRLAALRGDVVLSDVHIISMLLLLILMACGADF